MIAKDVGIRESRLRNCLAAAVEDGHRRALEVSESAGKWLYRLVSGHAVDGITVTTAL